jgi:hypothetical protein
VFKPKRRLSAALSNLPLEKGEIGLDSSSRIGELTLDIFFLVGEFLFETLPLDNIDYCILNFRC